MAKADAYLDQLQQLLPPGAAWPRDSDATLTALLQSVAQGMAKVDARSLDLITEADPRSTLEMLGDWETTAGLPDACFPAGTTLTERRNALVQRLTTIGGQTPQFFIDLATGLGHASAVIEEFTPAICGLGQCGDALNGAPSVRFYWRIILALENLLLARCASTQCGDNLGTFLRASALECVLKKLAPAQTTVLFSYLETTVPFQIDNLALALIGDRSPFTLNAGKVSQWNDISGNANHAAQATATKQPAYAASGVNGLPSVDFDGVNDALSVPASASIKDIFAGGGYGAIVFISDAAGTFDYLIEKDGRWGIYINASKLTFFSIWDGNDGGWSTGETIPIGSPVLLEFEYDSDSAANDAILRINGGGTTSQWGTPTGTVLSDSGVDLSLGNVPSTFSPWDGDIAEVALYSSLPSAAEQSLLRNHLANKYGITLS
ncbi:MAG: hypothetical protein COA65_08835 [Rhodospirillaceae bacterium]|nr:MAG: hypothetical protein COA65_08835 [Rhodospirillaceae bacterium]